MNNNWINTDDQKPASGKRVLVCIQSTKYDGKKIQNSAIAEYVAPYTIKSEDYFCSGEAWGLEEFDESGTGDLWVVENWYESPIEDETMWAISDKVTHWKYLDKLPEMES